MEGPGAGSFALRWPGAYEWSDDQLNLVLALQSAHDRNARLPDFKKSFQKDVELIATALGIDDTFIIGLSRRNK